MLAFEVYWNGKKLCTVGKPSEGVLQVGIRSYSVTKSGSGESDGPTRVEGMQLSVSGNRRTAGGGSESVSWVEHDVAEGDEVTLRIVDVDEVDDPVRVNLVDEELFRKLLRAQVRKSAKNS